MAADASKMRPADGSKLILVWCQPAGAVWWKWPQRRGQRRFPDAGAAVVGAEGTQVSVRAGDGGQMSAPVVAADGLSATYVEVWPGVDLRFVVDNVSVRKELVINRPGTANVFEVVFDGLDLVASDAGPGWSLLTARSRTCRWVVWRCSVATAPRSMRSR